MSGVISANYELEKGADFIQNIVFRNPDRSPLDLTGYSASAKIRKYPTSQYYNTVNVIFSNRSQGQIRLFINRDQTLLLAPGRNYYDVMLTDPDGITSKKIELDSTSKIKIASLLTSNSLSTSPTPKMNPSTRPIYPDCTITANLKT